MSLAGLDSYRTTLPAQSNSVQIQFYLKATDELGAVSYYPPGGTNSRAFIKVDNAPPAAKVPIVRMLMNPKEALGRMPLTNLLSDDYVECTLVIDEKEVIFGAGARLHGSMWSRQTQESTGFNVKFPSDHPYKGIRTSLILRRRDQGEIICRHMLVNARDVPGNYDEFVHLLSPLPGNAGIARVLFGNDDPTWLNSQFTEGSSAQVLKMEGIREFTATANGNPEGYKLAMPIGWIQSFDIRDLGDDPEQYRWSTLLSNHREKDDFSHYIAMAKVFSLTGTNLQQAVPQVMDIDEWTRVFALQSLCGVADVYTIENPHNLGYLVRPSDGKVLALQNDWSFYFNRGAGEALIGIQNLSRIFNIPVYKRVYYGNVLDLINTTFNRDYMNRWLQHYGDLAGESFTSISTYIRDRTVAAKAQLPKVVPFEILSNGGDEWTTNSPVVQVLGRGWIDVHRVTLNSPSNIVSVQWLDGERWQTLVALAPVTNDLRFTAYDRSGAKVGEDAIRVIASITDRPQKDYLRITEIMYSSPAPTEGEIQSGFSDADDFEFIELTNIGLVPVSLKGVQFTLGVKFTFGGSAPSQLEPGQRVLVVKNLAAFQVRYSGTHLIAGVYSGSLDNGGEVLRLVDELGSIIEEIDYRDDQGWPTRADGGGSSLERFSFAGNPSDSSHWQPSIAWGGSPGDREIVSPGLSAMTTQAGQLNLRLILPAGSSYRLEYRQELDRGDWQPLRTFSSDTNARVEDVTDPILKESRARYYRLSAQ